MRVPSPAFIRRRTTRAAGALALVGALLTAGCGYVGEPLPPALRRPVPVTDLTATEHGSKIVIQFTVPKVTTEDLPVARPEMELRAGPFGDSFNPETWVSTSEVVPTIPVEKGIARVELDAARYAGKTIALGVNVHGPHGRTAGWSNFVAVAVVPPLAKPDRVEATDAPDAVQLRWRSTAPEFRIFRRAGPAGDWTRIGIAPKPEYTDSTIEYGLSYQYSVQAQQKAGDGYAESEGSEAVEIRPVDRFAPVVPTGLTVVAGAGAMELLWDRNTERDFASYRIYRNGKVLAQGVTSPAYTDRDVQSGVKYEYSVSALDTAGNESAKSAAVSSEIP